MEAESKKIIESENSTKSVGQYKMKPFADLIDFGILTDKVCYDLYPFFCHLFFLDYFISDYFFSQFVESQTIKIFKSCPFPSQIPR